VRSQTYCALLALTYARSLAERKRFSQQVVEQWFPSRLKTQNATEKITPAAQGSLQRGLNRR
jgi:hypothetical protein